MKPYLSPTKIFTVFVFMVLFVFFAPTTVEAAINNTSTTLNGLSSVEVAPNANISATVNVTTTQGTKWKSTSWRINAGASTCVNHDDTNGNNDFSKTFNIIAPATAGIYSVTFVSSSNDSCEGTTDSSTMSNAISVITVNNPEINVIGIADGGTDTSFGTALVDGGFIDKIYTIQNTGTANLTIGAFTVTGDFTLQTAPALTTIPSGGSTTFTIRFDPTNLNERIGSVSIVNNDSDENPYNFNVSGIGDGPPIIDNIPNQIATISTPFILDISTYVTTTNGDPILNYTLTGTLPDGLSFDTTTGLIGGSATTVTAATSFSVIARDKDGNSNEVTFTLAVNELDIVTTGGREFALRHQENLFGDVKVIGNTVLCQKNTIGQCIESGNNISNNAVNLQKASESGAELILPTNAVIKFARLYWLGRTDNGWNTTTQNSAGMIEIKKGSAGAFTQLNANIKDAIRYSGDIYLYSASADASTVVNSSGTYYINTSSFYTTTGTTSDGLGTSGSWALVVVYLDPDSSTAKNVTIFDGYKGVTSNTDAQASVTGFLTPKSGLVDSTLYVMAAEGDKYLSGTSDQIQMAGATYNTSLENLGTFDSRIDLDATRTPNLVNNNGTDLHVYNVGTSDGGRGIITTNEVGAEFNFTSNQDVYYPSLFVFSTELYLPQLCYDYSIRQDGRYFSVDRATYPEAQIDQIISSSPLEIGIYLRNIEADLPAEGIAIRTDLNATKFNQVGNIFTSNVNGSSFIDRGTPAYGGVLCDYDKDGNNLVINNGCTDGHNIRKGNGSLDANNYVYTKFFLAPRNVSGLTDINESLGLSIKYYITANGSKIEYPDYVLGGPNVPLCPPTTSYTPQRGQFNVVRSGQQNDSITNNLYTQVSRKPFGAAIVFDSTPETGDNTPPDSDINTTLIVEIMDIGSYGDINGSCDNPDANLSAPIFITANFSDEINQIDIPSQTADYYNFATQNATFRIWYFDDGNSILKQNWTATTSDAAQQNLSSISGLYDSNVHPLCTSYCQDSTSVGCYNCIKNNYAKALCSRDNFAVRPESYSLNIFDVNQSLPKSSPDKDATKINLSAITGYAPSGAAPTDSIHLAAGYNYRFDINASGNNGISFAPGYTRVFNGGTENYATFIWSPATAINGCNDTINHNVEFYFDNGKILNEERLHTNVGDYILNIIDTTWTYVDWIATSHQTADNGFDITDKDCILNSNATGGAPGLKNGCTITTNHGIDSVGNFYRDHDLTFHPYSFDLTGVTGTVGLNNAAFTPNTYLYMSDMSGSAPQDENMSLHLNGIITAVGFDNNPLSNFVNNCYAVGLDLNLSKSDTNLTDINGNSVVYQSRFHNLELNNSIILAHDRNTSEINSLLPLRVQTLPDFFRRDFNGSLNTIHNFNYDRNISSPANPITITFNNYDVNCTNPTADCTMFADLRNDKTTNGRFTLDRNITHYYGRTNAPRQNFEAPVGTSATPGEAFIYYETYCDITTGCDKTILQDGVDSNFTNDPRWFINTSHISATHGVSDIDGNVTQKNANRVTNSSLVDNNVGTSSAFIFYDASAGYPYRATMQNSAPSWLLYNKHDIGATNNEFEVEFINQNNNWAGVRETTTTTDSNATSKTNRRVMW